MSGKQDRLFVTSRGTVYIIHTRPAMSFIFISYIYLSLWVEGDDLWVMIVPQDVLKKCRWIGSTRMYFRTTVLTFTRLASTISLVLFARVGVTCSRRRNREASQVSAAIGLHCICAKRSLLLYFACCHIHYCSDHSPDSSLLFPFHPSSIWLWCPAYIAASLNPQYDAAGLWTDISELCVYLDFLITNEVLFCFVTIFYSIHRFVLWGRQSVLFMTLDIASLSQSDWTFVDHKANLQPERGRSRVLVGMQVCGCH